MQGVVAAAVVQQRVSVRGRGQRLHAADDDVVIAAVVAPGDAGLDVRGGAVERGRAVRGGCPGDARELVGAAAGERIGQPALSVAEDIDAEERGRGELRPGCGCLGRAEQHHGRVKGQGGERLTGKPGRAAAGDAGDYDHAAGEVREDVPEAGPVDGR